MVYARSKQEIKALAKLLCKNNNFCIPHFSYKQVKPYLNQLINTLEYAMILLNRAFEGKKVCYSDSPEIYAWLMKESSPILDSYDYAIEKMMNNKL